MRAVVQRVSEASVTVVGRSVAEKTLTGAIQTGLLVLLGVAREDEPLDAEFLAEKVTSLRIFEDDEGRMNRSLIDVGGGLLAVSQFTLLGDCRRGRRPSFADAAPPEQAEQLYEHFIAQVAAAGVEVAQGKFRHSMQVALVNDGPVTLMIDSRKQF